MRVFFFFFFFIKLEMPSVEKEGEERGERIPTCEVRPHKSL
jgi:hypothetical protein